jgi:hypothetical protein
VTDVTESIAPPARTHKKLTRGKAPKPGGGCQGTRYHSDPNQHERTLYCRDLVVTLNPGVKLNST